MNRKLTIILAVLLVSLFRLYVAAHPELNLGGFSPLMALAFMGGWIWKDSRFMALFTVSILVVTDLALNSLQGYPGFHSFMMMTSICYLLTFQIGSKVQPYSGFSQLLALVGCSVGFYMLTNTFSWLGSTQYPQSFQGWVQSWTTGLPGYPPSYLFFRNALLSDLFFWGLLKAAFICLPQKTANNSSYASTL